MEKILKGLVVSFICFTSFTHAGNVDATNETVLVKQCRDSLLETFPNTEVEHIEEAPIPGICEISAGTNVLYFRPDGANGLLIAGAILDKTGRNYTEEKSQILVANKINTLPLDKSIKQGDGPVKVVIYTDVDCPFCRDLEKGLSQYHDLASKATIHTFLYPLSMHPKAEVKSRWVLCQQDKAQALKDVMNNGVLDDDTNNKLYPIQCTSSEVDQLLSAGVESGKSLGIKGTPSIFVNGAQVRGNAETVYAAINKELQESLTSGASEAKRK